jgi:23S rRNA (guanine745-N1)-methyltransferase
MDFACPKCKGELILDINTKKCKNNHCFDKAKAGYYNLLLGVGGGTHGDNAEMVEARRAFLSRGFYEPLADRIASLVTERTPVLGCVLDAGCGEGYYTDKVERSLCERDGDSNVLAFDISRDAVKFAAKRNRNISLAVATSYDMPLANESVDTVFNAFSPLAISEVSRVLKLGGRFVMVYPGREHLYGLKSVIYKTPYKNEPEEVGLDGFKLLSHETLSYTLKLDTEGDIRALFMMTPYAYRTSREDRERVLSLSEVTTEVEFVIDVYEKI